MVQVDVSQAINALQKLARLTPRQQSVVIARALNHTAAKAQTAANRKIREVYNIKARDVRRAMKRIRARASHLEARIDITGAPLPLLAFAARQIRTGVSVAVFSNNRRIVQRAFIKTMPSGHKGVFARGQYERGTFGFRTKRLSRNGSDLPITELTSVAIPHTLANSAVVGAIAQGIERNFANRLEHELQRLIAGLPPMPDFDPIQ